MGDNDMVSNWTATIIDPTSIPACCTYQDLQMVSTYVGGRWEVHLLGKEGAIQCGRGDGGQLTILSHFGTDPLEDRQRAERDKRLKANILDFPTILQTCLWG